MRFHFVRRWLLTIALAGGVTTAIDTAHAQPKDRNDNRPGNYGKKDDKPDTRYTGGAPKSPPPLRVAEPKPAPQKGKVWISGHHDWKNGKWEWVPGKWETARPGRKPQAPRWEKKGDIFVKIELTWVDVPLPPAKDEPAAKTPKPGQSWQAGQFEWSGSDWTWVPGKWVAEQKGKKWRPHTWTKKGDDWVENKGDWEEDKHAVVSHPKSAPPPTKDPGGVSTKGDQTWDPGRWEWKNNKWEWQNGHWEKTKPGHKFRAGKWEQKGDHWEWQASGWEALPTQGPPPLKEEKHPPRPGQVFIAGHWEFKGGKWDWTPGRWEKERPGEKFRAPLWKQDKGQWVFVDGAWEKDKNAGGGELPKTAPPARTEPRPAPKKGETWIAGHHDWKGGKWEWVPGKWEPAKPGRRAEPPKWEKKGDVFVKVELKWVDVPVPPKKVEPQAKTPKPGQSWQGGHYEWNGNDWTWVAGKWVPEVKGKKWRDASWTKKGDDWVETKGDWEDDKTPAKVEPKMVEPKKVEPKKVEPAKKY